MEAQMRAKIALFAAALMLPVAAQAAAYHVVNTYTLGGDGGWDYLNLDPATGNLFLTRGNHVMVVAPASGGRRAGGAGRGGGRGAAGAGGGAGGAGGGAGRRAGGGAET